MSNYRGISLMSTMAKLYNRVLLNRIRPTMDKILRNTQAGFRPGRSTINQIHSLRRILEAAEEKQLPLIITFVDFRKAFDSINRRMMHAILRHYGIPEKVVNAVTTMYNNTKGVVLVNGKSSDPFNITTGVLQGDVLAPFLFVIVIDYVMSNSESDFGFEYLESEGTRSRRVPSRKLGDLGFADDIALLENKISTSNRQLETVARNAKQVGLHINTEKTEYMTLNQPKEEQEQQLMLDNTELKRVNDFKYLGANLACAHTDLRARKGQAWGAFWKLKNIWYAKHLEPKLKINIYKVAVLSILLYGAETWTITPVMEREINGFGTNCLRIILGIRRIDRVTNEEVYSRTQQSALINTVRQRQLGYLGHVLRIADKEEPAKKFALYEPKENHGSRKRGPPKLRFRPYIASLMPYEEPTTEQIVALAQNRDNWRKIVAGPGFY
jgi:hypothetical protein